MTNKNLVALKYHNTIISLDQTQNLISLNQLWKAANSPKGKDPRNWLELDQSAQFIYALEVKLNVAKDSLLKTQRGRGGGTWGCFEIALEYAAYLSPEMRVTIAQWIAKYKKEQLLSELLEKTVSLEITNQSGFVYLIKAGSENIYKIGCSTSPLKRLSSLQTSNHQELQVIHRVFSLNMWVLEKALHQYYSSCQVRGEWYQLTPEQVEYFPLTAYRLDGQFEDLQEAQVIEQSD